jgi:putative two-component system response regulator
MTDLLQAPRMDAATALVVDDDPQMRRLLTSLLKAEGFTCEVAGDVAEARVRLETFAPAVVVLDLRMPGESGVSLAHELSRRHGGPAVIMVSGEDDAEVAQIALDAGALAYLTKPFKRNELAIAIRTARDRQREVLVSQADRSRLEERVIERSAAVHDALEHLRAANEETVLRLSKAVEYRDPESGWHIERMSHYCALLAGTFGFDSDLIRVASRLHDVGKIAIPDAILLKPGQFTAEERDEMEHHAELGHRLLQGSSVEVLKQAATIAWTHHEHFDGNGYPRGLAGEEIPLVGRIACVADVFDALTTDRIYRSAMSTEDATALLIAERGHHFDPRVVDAFLAVAEEVSAIFVRFAEKPPEGEEPADVPVPHPLVTLQHAASTLGISPAQLRRWSDDGRIEAVRTPGGHRRFSLEAVRLLAAERGSRPVVSPLEPPAARLPLLARCLRERGSELTATTAAALYRGGPAGWFAGEDAAAAGAEWLRALAHGCDSGDYRGALHASDIFMRRGQLQAVSLLERHCFLERFGYASLQALTQTGVAQGEMAAVRQVFVACQQAHLDGRS